MDYIVRAYNIVFYERADQRVKDWMFMKSPIPLATIIFTYLLLIKIVLPVYMRNRKPYDLRTIIKWYNIGQILGNIVVSWGMITSGWTTTYHFGCLLPDYSNNPEALRMLRFMWWTVVLKLFELFETIFFILRKKERQASFLHIYHHISTLMIVWSGTKYIGGGMASLPPLLNNCVHVIMYSYYLLSSEGSPKVKSILNKYKMWLTIVQMIQFNILLGHSSQVFLPSCPAPIGVMPLYFPSVIIVYYMFYKFFKENYLNKRAKGSKRKTTKIQFNILLGHSFQMFLPSCPAPIGITPLYFPSIIIVYYMFYKFFKENYLNRGAKGSKRKTTKVSLE